MGWKKLPKKAAAKFEEVYAAAEALENADDHRGAWRKFADALQLVPEPESEYWETVRCLTAMGDAAFALGRFDMVRDTMQDALNCGVTDNPFVHLRLGQAHFELGDEKKAAHHLTCAYMLDARKPFADEDPKYFALLESVLKPPAGQARL